MFSSWDKHNNPIIRIEFVDTIYDKVLYHIIMFWHSTSIHDRIMDDMSFQLDIVSNFFWLDLHSLKVNEVPLFWAYVMDTVD